MYGYFHFTFVDRGARTDTFCFAFVDGGACNKQYKNIFTSTLMMKTNDYSLICVRIL